MRKWLVICAAGAVMGYVAVYFALDGRPAPEADPQPPAAPAAPAGPVVLAQVVEVTDLDPLLNPPPAAPAGAPFDPTEPLESTTPGAPAPIPPAAEGEEQPTAVEVAPAPHEVSVRPALDPARTSWYGEEVFHRQLYDWLAEQANPLLRLANGNGYFF